MRTYQGKEEEGGKPKKNDACKRDMTKAGLKEDSITNRASGREKINSNTVYRLSATPDEGPRL